MPKGEDMRKLADNILERYQAISNKTAANATDQEIRTAAKIRTIARKYKLLPHQYVELAVSELLQENVRMRPSLSLLTTKQTVDLVAKALRKRPLRFAGCPQNSQNSSGGSGLAELVISELYVNVARILSGCKLTGEPVKIVMSAMRATIHPIILFSHPQIRAIWKRYPGFVECSYGKAEAMYSAVVGKLEGTELWARLMKKIQQDR
jgi:hypothetical protein